MDGKPILVLDRLFVMCLFRELKAITKVVNARNADHIFERENGRQISIIQNFADKTILRIKYDF